MWYRWNAQGSQSGCVSAANHALYDGWQLVLRELGLDTFEDRVPWNVSSAPRPTSIRGRANPTAGAQIVRAQIVLRRLRARQYVRVMLRVAPPLQEMHVASATRRREFLCRKTRAHRRSW
jgi:hypothetical protein